MDFRRWIMREMGHIEVRHADDDMKAIDVIDPRFEQYPPGRKRLSMLSKYHGRLPNGKYLVNSRRSSEPAYISDEPPELDSEELPPDWLDYADIFFADGSRRKPLKGEDPDSK